MNTPGSSLMKGTRCYEKMGKGKRLIRPPKPISWLLWARSAGSSGLRVPQQPRTGGAGAAGHPEERGQQPAQEQRLQLACTQHGLSSKSQQWALSHGSCVHSSG